MHSNQFDNMILGTIDNSQGIVNAVVGMHRAALRALVARFARFHSLCLGSWRASITKRAAGWHATPIAATCPCSTGPRRQRDQRAMSGVVVDPGTVGVG